VSGAVPQLTSPAAFLTGGIKMPQANDVVGAHAKG